MSRDGTFAQLKAIAQRPPPLHAEDDPTETAHTGSDKPGEKSWGNARQRLSRLLRTTARQRASGKGKAGFSPLDDAVAALTSTRRTHALSSSHDAPDFELFEVRDPSPSLLKLASRTYPTVFEANLKSLGRLN